jgi:hypothetical protein
VTIGKANVNPGRRITMSPGSLPKYRDTRGQKIPVASNRTPMAIRNVRKVDCGEAPIL